METLEKKWYVLHTYSGYENKVKENLLSRAQSMGMENYIFRVCVPEEEEVEVTKTGKEKVLTHKIFPGYVLVEMVMTDESWYIVRNTPGVTGFVGSHGAGSKPSPLLDEEIIAILSDMGESVHDGNNEFEVGEHVKIMNGAFKGLTGKIELIDDENQKVKLSVDMFGSEAAVDLEVNQIDHLS